LLDITSLDVAAVILPDVPSVFIVIDDAELHGLSSIVVGV
jgi:hypothetical protein